jgi:hypothetical protein
VKLKAEAKAMKKRILLLMGVCVLVLGDVLAQYESNPPPEAAEGLVPSSTPESPAPSPTAVDEGQPTSVTTPTSDAQIDASTQPLTPQPSEPEGQADMMTQPESDVVSEEALAAVVPEETRKRWRLIPLFSAGFVYDDNIFLSNTDRVADFIWTFSGGLAFEAGDFRGEKENYLTAYWVGIPVIYTQNPEQNAFNQSAALSAQYRWTKLVAKLQSNFNVTKGPNREVNTITSTTSFFNSLRFFYDYSDKTTFDLGFSQLASIDEVFEDTYQYETRAGMEYQLFPKTRIGVEGAAGLVDSTAEPLQYYQQARLRANYLATGKLTVMLSGGLDVREYEGSDTVKTTPVFSLGLGYRPFDGTELRIVAYRNVVASNVVAGEDYTATGFEIAATQRLFQRFLASISLGYENDVYFSTGDGGSTLSTGDEGSTLSTGDEESTDRVDNYTYLRPRLTYNFIEWLSVSVFYEFRQTVSNQESSSFYGNRIGMEIATKF